VCVVGNLGTGKYMGLAKTLSSRFIAES
jgi:hypothetical protein